MKKRILLLSLATLLLTFGNSITCKSNRVTISDTAVVTNVYSNQITVSQNSISDINNVSFDLVENPSLYTFKSETDYNPNIIQQELELNRRLEELNQIDDMYEWYKKYKEIKEEFQNIFIEEFEHELITDVYTEDEIYYIERMVETETHGCSFEAHVNVANVVFNRVEHHKFPDNPKSVVTSPGQFCYGATKISESVKLAVEYAFMFRDTTNGALYFHSGSKTSTFNGRPLRHQDDAVHYFY